MPRRMRKTRKGGYDEAVPPNLLTMEKHREISEHLARAQGVGELENIISDISDVRKLDPQIFTGPDGEIARESLDFLLKHPGVMFEDEIRRELRYILEMLGKKLAERQGGRRRGRKTRRKTLRQRK